ncbi:MAG: hypothetical protein LBB41_00595, partial [Prevotellaceae bacterium]|nr:hypothetical protein [Prevotellaceae bacterium]
MKYNILHSKQILRFRRWSRAGYSAFRTLNRVVTIAQLRVSIADKAMLKLKFGICNAVNCLIFNTLECFFEELKNEKDFVFQNIFQMQMMPVAVIPRNDNAAFFSSV